jgi:hypothetical protein
MLIGHQSYLHYCTISHAYCAISNPCVIVISYVCTISDAYFAISQPTASSVMYIAPSAIPIAPPVSSEQSVMSVPSVMPI